MHNETLLCFLPGAVECCLTTRLGLCTFAKKKRKKERKTEQVLVALGSENLVKVFEWKNHWVLPSLGWGEGWADRSEGGLTFYRQLQAWLWQRVWAESGCGSPSTRRWGSRSLTPQGNVPSETGRTFYLRRWAAASAEIHMREVVKHQKWN